MGRVDPEDDSIQRYVALHHRYDPVRRERRHIALAAFDNEPEYQDFLAAANADLTAPQEAGKAEPGEHVSGRVYELG